MLLTQSLMNSLSYPKKMALIGIVFLIPIFLATSFLIYKDNGVLNQAAQEIQGVTFIRAVRMLYQHLPEHRGMTNAYLHGRHDYHGKILQKREAILADIAAIDRLDQQWGTQFKTHEQWQAIKQRWQQLEQIAFSQTASHIFRQHTELIAQVYALIEQISINAKLMTDPALDTTFIINALIDKLPLLTEQLGQARGMGSGIAAAKTISVSQRISLGAKIANIRSYSATIDHALRQAVAINPALGAQIEPLQAKRRKIMAQFLNTVDSALLQTEFVTIDATRFFELGTQAIAVNYALFDTLLPVLEKLLQQRMTHYTFERNTILVIIMAALLVALLLFIGFYRSTLASIAHLVHATQKVANGDMTVNIHSTTSDEMGQIATALNQMVQHLNEMIQKLGNNASVLASASEELSATNVQVADNSQSQQAQTQQISASMNQLAETVQDITSHASTLASEASHTNEETHKSSSVINQTIESITTLAQGVGQAATVIHGLQEKSNEIGSVLNVIKSVAEQTNLLALNAAIEAARAGDHGRGFAVVADEVRTLANRTQESAEQIQEMVDNLQHHTQQAVTVMNKEQQNAEDVSQQTQAATESLQQIVNSITKISSMSAEMATIAQTQERVSQSINQNVDQVSQLSEHNAQGVQQMAAASDELAKLAAELEKIIQFFKVTIR